MTIRIGSSVEIYGVTYKDDWMSGCPSIMYFSWPAGSATYTYSDYDTGPDRLFVKATGFNPREISYVSFKQVNPKLDCLRGGGLDYAIVYVEDRHVNFILGSQF
jgi:hypothetical protein